jgi:hypothetical protein
MRLILHEGKIMAGFWCKAVITEESHGVNDSVKGNHYSGAKGCQFVSRCASEVTA